MNDKVYWVWLQQALKYGSNRIRTVNLIYESAEAFYHAGPNEWQMCGCFTQKEISFMESCKLEKAYSILDNCQKLGHKVITMQDEKYPERLKQIVNPPCVLYVKGELPKIDSEICISVVGTRSATLYGLQMSFDISLELARAGAIIVSGGALGVDGEAHKGCIQGGGKTIAVLGCGIDYHYLMQNAPLRDVISRNGALISEFAPGFPAYPSNFAMRNRIISGLSLGTVVIEAGRKSGSLITAAFALEQNRDVFAVPVDMNSSVSEGTTALIRDGAKVVTCGEDILSEYRTTYFRGEDFKQNSKRAIFVRPEKETYEKETGIPGLKTEKIKSNDSRDLNLESPGTIKGNTGNKINNVKSDNIKINNYFDISTLSPDEQNVYNVLKNGKRQVDCIAAETKLPIRKLLPVLTAMELSGIIEPYAGRIYGLAGQKGSMG